MFIIVVFVILYIFYFEVYDFLEYDVKYFLILKCLLISVYKLYEKYV